MIQLTEERQGAREEGKRTRRIATVFSELAIQGEEEHGFGFASDVSRRLPKFETLAEPRIRARHILLASRDEPSGKQHSGPQR
jgi:hypothetical protein